MSWPGLQNRLNDIPVRYYREPTRPPVIEHSVHHPHSPPAFPQGPICNWMSDTEIWTVVRHTNSCTDDEAWIDPSDLPEFRRFLGLRVKHSVFQTSGCNNT